MIPCFFCYSCETHLKTQRTSWLNRLKDNINENPKLKMWPELPVSSESISSSFQSPNIQRQPVNQPTTTCVLPGQKSRSFFCFFLGGNGHPTFKRGITYGYINLYYLGWWLSPSKWELIDPSTCGISPPVPSKQWLAGPESKRQRRWCHFFHMTDFLLIWESKIYKEDMNIYKKKPSWANYLTCNNLNHFHLLLDLSKRSGSS